MDVTRRDFVKASAIAAAMAAAGGSLAACASKPDAGQQGAGDAVTDSAGLAGNAAASDGANDIKLAQGIGKGHGLTNDQLQSIQAEIIVDVSAVNGDLAGAGVQTNAGHGALSTAGAIVIGILALVHGLFLLSIKFLRASGQRGRGSHHGRCGSGSVPCGRWCYRGSCP